MVEALHTNIDPEVIERIAAAAREKGITARPVWNDAVGIQNPAAVSRQADIEMALN